ncbi:MAG: hypothetical protein RSG51_04020, partial [Bacilli bacterium]
YAVCTNLQDSPEEIIKINKQRWEIEESFRIMKSEFKASLYIYQIKDMFPYLKILKLLRIYINLSLKSKIQKY